MSSAKSPKNASLGKLSAAEAAELASGVAELTKAGLPLPEGLRALAEEWPKHRSHHVLLDLADRVEQGASLNQAIDAIGTRLPVYLRGLITSGIRSGRLAEALERYVELERTQHELRRQVWINLAYPTILMLVMTLLAVLLNFFIVHQMQRVYLDFGTDLPGITKVLIAGSWPFTCLLLIISVILLSIPLLLSELPGSSWVTPVLSYVPFIGRLLKWSQMAKFSRMMAMLLQQQTPLAESLRLSSKGLSNAYLSRSCRAVADEIEQGRPLSQSIAAHHEFSHDLLPIVELGERASILGDAFDSAADMFEGRASAQGRNLETILLPGAFLIIVCFYGVFVIGMFMPLIQLVTKLTGGK